MLFCHVVTPGQLFLEVLAKSDNLHGLGLACC